MATLIIIEDRPRRASRLSVEHFVSDGEALNRAFHLICEEERCAMERTANVISLRIECEDDLSVIDDTAVRRLARLERGNSTRYDEAVIR